MPSPARSLTLENKLVLPLASGPTSSIVVDPLAPLPCGRLSRRPDSDLRRSATSKKTKSTTQETNIRMGESDVGGASNACDSGTTWGVT